MKTALLFLAEVTVMIVGLTVAGAIVRVWQLDTTAAVFLGALIGVAVRGPFAELHARIALKRTGGGDD